MTNQTKGTFSFPFPLSFLFLTRAIFHLMRDSDILLRFMPEARYFVNNTFQTSLQKELATGP